jgi:HSP20 family molecular chaperone IbpA
MTRASRALAVAALLSAPAAHGFMFGAPCTGFNTAGAVAAMKAINKFQPKVEDTTSSVTFKFEAVNKEDVEVNMAKLGAASVLNVSFKGVEMPFFQSSSCNSESKSGISRSFFMPPTIAADDMTSSWEAGILTVTLPKKVQDEVKQQQRSQPQQPQQPQQQQSISYSSSADYLRSLSQQQQQQQQRPRATKEPTARAAESQQQASTSSSSSTSNTQQAATAGQYIDQLLSEMFGVAPGTDPFAPPSAEWIAAAEQRAAKAEEARIARRNAMRRASMHTTWEQSSEQYTITIEIPQGTRAGAVKLVAAEGRALEVRLANGAVKRIQLPRDARVSSVKAKFERDGDDKSQDLVARCVVTVPKEQPQSINIEMA